MCETKILQFSYSCYLVIANGEPDNQPKIREISLDTVDELQSLDWNQARSQRGGGGLGALPPDFYFCPPDLFLALPLYFFIKVSIALTVKMVVILTVPSPILTSILFD